jgi:hypothetical protein
LRDGRQRGSARGQMQKISAGKFHFEPPSHFTSLDHLVGAQQVPPLAVVFNLCDRRFDTRSGCMTWHLMKK